jgi:hypothetical protein
MNCRSVVLVVSLMLLVARGTSAEEPSAPDKSPHKVRFVTVDKHVRLEVLDWGGSVEK